MDLEPREGSYLPEVTQEDNDLYSPILLTLRFFSTSVIVNLCSWKSLATVEEVTIERDGAGVIK